MFDDQMLWFVLIFVIPFLPAIIVFLLIKPQAGDTLVGGSVPFFKNLKIELAGAIGTYFVVVLISLVAFQVITSKKLIAFSVEPVSPDGRPISISEINTEFLVPPKLSVRASPPGSGQRALSWTDLSGDLELVDGRLEFTSSRAYQIANHLDNGVLYGRINNSGAYLGSEIFELETSPTIYVKARMTNQIMADWLNLFMMDRIWYDETDKSLRFEIVSVLRDQSVSQNLRRIQLGAVSMEGLTSIDLQLFRTSADNSDDFTSYVESVRQKSATETTRNQLRDNFNKFLEKAILLDNASISYDDANPYRREIVPENPESIWFFMNAPSPRVSLKNEWLQSGDDYVIRLSLVVDDVDSFFGDESPYVTVYNFGTKLALFDMELKGYGLKLEPQRQTAEIESPVHNEILSDIDDHFVKNETGTFYLARELPKNTRAKIPLTKM